MVALPSAARRGGRGVDDLHQKYGQRRQARQSDAPLLACSARRPGRSRCRCRLPTSGRAKLSLPAPDARARLPRSTLRSENGCPGCTWARPARAGAAAPGRHSCARTNSRAGSSPARAKPVRSQPLPCSAGSALIRPRRKVAVGVPGRGLAPPGTALATHARRRHNRAPARGPAARALALRVDFAPRTLSRPGQQKARRDCGRVAGALNGTGISIALPTCPCGVNWYIEPAACDAGRSDRGAGPVARNAQRDRGRGLRPA